MNKIFIKGLRIYAHHGVMPQETAIGAYFTIDITITTDFNNAIETDELDGTISYADVYDVIKREMSVPSKLLEHAAGRIVKALMTEYENISEINITLTKENPPMGADCSGAGIEITKKR